MTDVITMLKQEHREVEEMAGALDSAEGLEGKKEAARRIIRELLAGPLLSVADHVRDFFEQLTA